MKKNIITIGVYISAKRAIRYWEDENGDILTFDDVASAKQYLYDTGMTDEDIANEGIAFVPGEEVDGEDQENYVSVPFPFSFEKETIDEELWNAPITTEEAKAKVHQYLASAGMEAMN